jgi:hypothetical protein
MALGALVRACYWGSTPLIRIWYALQQTGLTLLQTQQFIVQCLDAKVLESHRLGAWLSMTGAGRQFYRDFDSIRSLASA